MGIPVENTFAINVLANDLGKTNQHAIFVRVTTAGGALQYERVGDPFHEKIPPLDTLEDVVKALTAVARRLGVSLPQVRLALTVPLPQVGGRYLGRKKLMFFHDKTPTEIGAQLKAVLNPLAVTQPHDSASQLKYMLGLLAPVGVSAILACGTSFALALGSAKDPGIFADATSTFSHTRLQGNGPLCERCGGACVGKWYQDLFNTGQDTTPAVLAAVGAVARLPISNLYVSGGAMGEPRLRAAVESLRVPLATTRIQVVPDPVFAGAIGAALIAAES